VEFRFRDIPVIDGHIHFTDPDQMGNILSIANTVPMAQVNLLSTPRPGGINQNPAVMSAKLRQPQMVYISGGLDYAQVLGEGWSQIDPMALFRNPDAATLQALADQWSDVDPAAMSENLGQQIRAFRAIGFDGLKLIESKPTSRKVLPLPLDAPHYEGMWAALEDLEMPVIWHVADPEEFWDEDQAPDWAKQHGWFYGDGTFPTKEALYTEVDNVLARHPGLQVVFAHFYFLSADLARAGHFLDTNPNVCLDLTPGNEMITNFTRNFDAARDFFVAYQDRLVYGTDIATRGLDTQAGMARALGTAWAVRMYLETTGTFAAPGVLAHWRVPDLQGFRGFGLRDDLLAKIYCTNFQRLYGSEPAELDRTAALEELARMASVLDTAGGDGTNPARLVSQMMSG